MTNEKVKAVFQFYLEILTSEATHRAALRGIGHISYSAPQQFSTGEMFGHSNFPFPNESAHLRFMCIEAQQFVDDGRIDKAMRWLGFLQGVLWARGLFSLDDLKNHSRPDSELALQ